MLLYIFYICLRHFFIVSEYTEKGGQIERQKNNFNGLNNHRYWSDHGL